MGRRACSGGKVAAQCGLGPDSLLNGFARTVTTVILPEGAPQNLGEAFAHIGKATAPSVLDMKVMVLTEAAALLSD